MCATYSSSRGCELTTERRVFRVFRSVIVGFSQPKTCFFCSLFRLLRKTDYVFFRSLVFTAPDTCKKKQPKPTDSSVKKRKTDRSRFQFWFTTPTATKTRPKPTDIFGEKTKNRPSYFCFRFNYGSQLTLVATCTNTCTPNPLKLCIFAGFTEKPTEKCSVSVACSFGLKTKSDRNRPTSR